MKKCIEKGSLHNTTKRYFSTSHVSSGIDGGPSAPNYRMGKVHPCVLINTCDLYDESDCLKISCPTLCGNHAKTFQVGHETHWSFKTTNGETITRLKFDVDLEGNLGVSSFWVTNANSISTTVPTSVDGETIYYKKLSRNFKTHPNHDEIMALIRQHLRSENIITDD